MRRDIAKLLEAGQEAIARIRVWALSRAWEIRLDWNRVRRRLANRRATVAAGGAHRPGGEHDGRAGDPRALLRARCSPPAHHRDAEVGYSLHQLRSNNIQYFNAILYMLFRRQLSIHGSWASEITRLAICLPLDTGNCFGAAW
jgi:hypothetical protein